MKKSNRTLPYVQHLIKFLSRTSFIWHRIIAKHLRDAVLLERTESELKTGHILLCVNVHDAYKWKNI